MNFILETERLYLRAFDLSDAEKFYELNLNPNVIKFTGNSAFKNIEEAKSFLEDYNDYKINGYGRWAVINKTSNQFIGWCGLKYNEIENETDIGFRFFEKEWNKGYATESSTACLKYGFEILKLHRIIGRAMKENKASIKVLEKIGLTYESDCMFENNEAVIYKIEK